MKQTLFFLLLIASSYSLSAQTQIGKASFYADKFQGRKTASGEIFFQGKMTAAHRTLPFGTKVKVTNKVNEKSVIVRINDRGPFVKDRIIDLSKTAAKRLGFLNKGVANVRVEVVQKGAVPSKITTKVKKEVKPLVTTPVSIKKQQNTTQNENPITPSKTINQFYHLQVASIQPRGYAIQLGSFQKANNMLELTSKLAFTYKKDITLQVHKQSSKLWFSVLIGPFMKKEKADQFQLKLSADYPNSFVISLAKYQEESTLNSFKNRSVID